MNDQINQDANDRSTDESDLLRMETLRECEALIAYIGRHGNILHDPDGNNVQGPLDDYDELVSAVVECRNQGLTTDNWKPLARAYAKVTRFTYKNKGINGRSLLDTWAGSQSLFGQSASSRTPSRLAFMRGHKRPLSIAVGSFAAAIVLQAGAGWAGRVSDPGNLGAFHAWIYWPINDLAPLLLSVFWGAIGSCIFLMKRISDKLFDMSYESARQKGDVARIFVGAFLGVAVVQLFFPDFGETLAVGDITFGPPTAALTAGLAVKPIYAAFEALAEGIASLIPGQNK